jgi:ElaB/YqjD/DUF883 family membrane-anchored ribosome-binding protein
MRLIKKINLKPIREFTEKIVEISSNIRLLQEELENILSYASELEKFFSAGKLSKETFETNKTMLKKEKVRVSSKLNQAIDKALKLIKKTRLVIEESRI